MGYPLPARRHEQIARAPLKRLLADPGAAAALDRGEYGGVGGTIARGLETLRQQLDEGADGRHREIAGGRIGKLQLQPVAGIPLVAQLRLFQRDQDAAAHPSENAALRSVVEARAMSPSL